MVIYNVIGYSIYLPVTFYITVVVGQNIHRHGRYYLLDIFHGKEEITDACNNYLLAGYYLLNLGYAALSVNFWNTVTNAEELVTELSTRLGLLILGLGVMHYLNLFWTSRYALKIQSLFKNMSNH